jgi:hypothetical protein
MSEEKPKPRSYKIYQEGSKFRVVSPDGEEYKLSNRATAFRIAHERAELVVNADGTTRSKMSHEEAMELVRLDKIRYKSGGVSTPGQRRADHRAEVARRKEQQSNG